MPADDLCTENAVMLNRFNRYPLIIDPSGQATEFLLQEYKDKKITKTSFLDDAFRKNLESALRFGNPLLVQDVESYDPILNPVLNKEVRKTGGRVLITLGDQDIDLSPAFTIFLSTRDPTVRNVKCELISYDSKKIKEKLKDVFHSYKLRLLSGGVFLLWNYAILYFLEKTIFF